MLKSILKVQLVVFLLKMSALLSAASDVVCSGTVLDRQGQAVSDAHVFLYKMSLDPTSYKVTRALAGQTISDSGGHFSFKTTPSKNEFTKWASVLATKKGMGIRWQSWDLQSGKTLELRFGNCAKLAGTIVGIDGQPAVNAMVRALLLLPADNSIEMNYFDWLTQRTDETGRFTFDYIPIDAAAGFYVEANGQSYCTAEHGILADSLTYHGGDDDYRVALSQSIALESSAHPLSYGEMLVNSKFLQYLTFREADIAAGTSESQDRSRTLSGVVTEDPFVPLPDVRISVYNVFEDDSQPFGFSVKLAAETTSDASGQYAIERRDNPADAEETFLIAYKDGYAFQVKLVSDDEADQQPLVLTFGRKAFTGVVKDNAGDPIAGAKVCAYVSQDTSDVAFPAFPLHLVAARTHWLTAVTDSQGAFTISGIPLYAKGEFSATADGYAAMFTWPTDRPLEAMTYPAGGKPITLVLRKVGAIRGRLVDASTGVAIENEKVFITKTGTLQSRIVWNPQTGSRAVRDAEGNNRDIITDADGRFVADGLAPGRYQVGLNPVAAGGRKWHVDSQTIDLGESQTFDVELSAAPLAVIAVLLTDDNQRPLEGASVTLRSARPQQRAETPSDSGLSVASRITYVPADSTDRHILFQTADPGSEMLLPVRTNADGKALFEVSAGEYMIESIRKTDYIYIPDLESINAVVGQCQETVVRLQSNPEYNGVCLSSAGRAAPDVQIKQLSFTDILATTDQQGMFQFSRRAVRRAMPSEARLIRLVDLAPYAQPAFQNRVLPNQNIVVAISMKTAEGGWVKLDTQAKFDLTLKPIVEAFGTVTNSQGSPLAADITVYAYPQEIGMRFYRQRFEQESFYFYDQVRVGPEGTFRLCLIPEFSYIVEVSVQGYVKKYERILSAFKDERGEIFKEDFISERLLKPDGTFTEKRIRVLTEGMRRMDFGMLQLADGNLSLSGVVVDRLGNPLKGYNVIISKCATIREPKAITDSQGKFFLNGLCEGMVEIYASNGDYDVYQREVVAGRDDVRIVISDHPILDSAIAQSPGAAQQTVSSDDLCSFEVILVDADTQQLIQIKDAIVYIMPENADDLRIKMDEQGKYLCRVKPGSYTIRVNARSFCAVKKDMKIEIKPGISNTLTAALRKYPVIEGTIHVPNSVGIDDLVVHTEPSLLADVSMNDYKIAGDGQFSCLVTINEKSPPYGWLWIMNKERNYLSRTKIPMKDGLFEITLQREATVKFKKGKYMLEQCTWEQKEHMAHCAGFWMPQSCITDDGEYITVRGLLAGQEDLDYVFEVRVTPANPLSVRIKSTELESGQVKIVELPESGAPSL